MLIEDIVLTGLVVFMKIDQTIISFIKTTKKRPKQRKAKSIVKNLALSFMNTTKPITAKSRINIRECFRQCQDWW